MITFIWKEDSRYAYADTEIEQKTEEICRELAHRESVEIYFCQDLFVTAMRLCILKGLISHKEIEFVFEDGKVIKSNKNAELEYYPKVLCVEQRILRELRMTRLNNIQRLQ